MTSVSPTAAEHTDSPEKVSITGTAFLKIPMPGRPECSGLLADGDKATARIEDGALVIDVDDEELALAWRNAFDQAANRLRLHRDRCEAQKRADATTPESETKA
ncbi:hypothetical protein [Actinomadura litoris]|uniref:hypothetical protein n=1 Tax=Actinomadura litoris TaxID=2678616 RepID=UPI001FA79009|nr:hypothetical protein [Actinomadura litoris]